MLIQVAGDLVTVPLGSCEGRFATEREAKAQARCY